VSQQERGRRKKKAHRRIKVARELDRQVREIERARKVFLREAAKADKRPQARLIPKLTPQAKSQIKPQRSFLSPDRFAR
jgi:hypothetical protein